MNEIPPVLLCDEFRNVLRDDIDFNSITHKSTKKKQRRIADAMTQLIINTCDDFEKHKNYPAENVVRLSRQFQKQMVRNFQPFQQALADNDFSIDHYYRPPTNTLGGITQSVIVPESKIKTTIHYLAQQSLESVELNDEVLIEWILPQFFGEHPIPSKIKISTSVLTDYCNSMKEVGSELYKKLHLQLRLSIAQENDGWLSQNYRVSDFGRLVGTGLSSLQTMPKTLLNEVLKGCAEVDVKTASMSLLPSIYNRVLNKTLTFPCIERYKEHSTDIREVVSHSLGVDLKMVKQAYTAMGFGLRKNTKTYKNVDNTWIVPTLTEIFLGNQSKAKSFAEHKEVKGLWKEVAEIYSALSKETKSTLPDYSPSQRVAYLYQHNEAEMLKVMMEFVGRSLVITKHDAIVLKSPLTNSQLIQLEDKIYQTLGFNVSFNQRILGND